MPAVVIHRLSIGAQKVALDLCLKESAGLTLAEAKRAVDQALEGNPVVITCAESVDPEKLAASLTDLGAMCTITPA